MTFWFTGIQKKNIVQLEKVLAQLEKAGITLNEDKCEFEVTETKFIGHTIDHKGIRADQRLSGTFK